MKRIAAPLFAATLVLAGVAGALSARIPDAKKYTCEMDFPDGTAGVAVVKVIVSDGESAGAPTVMVTVDYYAADGSHNGRFEDWSNSSEFPNDEYEAQEYAFRHFFDRW